jgi:TolA-binding protein
MAQFPSASASKTGPLPQLPDWVSWLQAGLTALLAVLFLVMVGKARQQGSQIRELQERLQGLENSRALERTTGLEEQLRSTVERLQVVERNTSRIDLLSAQAEALRAEVRQLKRSSGSGVTPPAPLAPPTAETPSSPAPAQPPAPPPTAPAP